MSDYSVYKKWKIPGTEVVVVLSDFKKVELLSVGDGMSRKKQFALISAHVWDSPDADVDAPLPPGWAPVNSHFKTLAEFDERLSMVQEEMLTDELALMSTPSGGSATFRRNGGGEVAGAGPGPNGEAVREVAVGDPGTAGAAVSD